VRFQVRIIIFRRIVVTTQQAVQSSELLNRGFLYFPNWKSRFKSSMYTAMLFTNTAPLGTYLNISTSSVAKVTSVITHEVCKMFLKRSGKKHQPKDLIFSHGFSVLQQSLAKKRPYFGKSSNQGSLLTRLLLLDSFN